MSKDPAFLFYDGDASRDVSHMSRLQRGAYFDFIQAQRKFCSKNENNTTVLPDGIPLETIKQILGKDFDECWPSLKLIMLENNGCFYIQWLKKSIDCRESFCQKQRENVNIRWNNRGNTVVIPPENENEINNTSLKRKKEEVQGKEGRKRQKPFVAPSREDVRAYFIKNGYPVSLADKFFNSYSVADWHDRNGNPIRNWNQKAINVWFKEAYKKPENKQLPHPPEGYPFA